jgi:hypothetical protein
MKINTMLLDRSVKQLDDLTEKEINRIQKWTRKFKSCTVYVDFEQTVLDKELNPELTDKHLTYLIVLKKKNSMVLRYIINQMNTICSEPTYAWILR